MLFHNFIINQRKSHKASERGGRQEAVGCVCARSARTVGAPADPPPSFSSRLPLIDQRRSYTHFSLISHLLFQQCPRRVSRNTFLPHCCRVHQRSPPPQLGVLVFFDNQNPPWFRCTLSLSLCLSHTSTARAHVIPVADFQWLNLPTGIIMWFLRKWNSFSCKYYACARAYMHTHARAHTHGRGSALESSKVIQFALIITIRRELSPDSDRRSL